MFSCDDLRAALSNYLDNEVPPEVRRALEQHLSECRTCRLLYDTTRHTVRLVTDAGSFEVPEDVSQRMIERLMGRIDAARTDPESSTE